MHTPGAPDSRPPGPLGPADARRELERACRLLACFQQALGHELPNQLVALQGLLRLLEAEASDCLDAECRGVLQRLVTLAQRTHALVNDLAELGRLGREPVPAGGVELAEVAREAVAEVSQLCRGRPVEYHIAAERGLTLGVPYRALRQVLVLLLRHAAQNAAADRPLRVEVGARRTPGGLEW